MQVTETLNEGLKRGYTITVPAAELDAKVTAKLNEIQPEVEIKGFRKGKVPMAMLRKQFGQRVLGEAMQDTIDGALQAHFEKTGDRPAMQPKIEMQGGEDWKEGDDLVVNVDYEALPEVPDFDPASLSLERLTVEASDEAVTEALDKLAENAKNFEPRKKGAKAKSGDQVVIDFIGRIDGEAFEGGSGEGYPLELGSGSFIPGFEDQLVGAKAGEKVDVTVSFPEEYGAKHLAGKEAVFECTVHEVKAPAKAELNDELAKRFGAEDLEALKTRVRDSIGTEYKGAARAVLKRALLDELDKAVKFDLPPSLVDAEAHQIAHSLWHEDHPEVHDHNHGAIETTDEHRSLAERRVRLGLLLADIGSRNKIAVSDAEMTQAVMMQARQYRGQERAFFEFVQKNPQMQQQLRAPIYEDKVVDHILSLATVTDKPVSKEDLEAAIEHLDEI